MCGIGVPFSWWKTCRHRRSPKSSQQNDCNEFNSNIFTTLDSVKPITILSTRYNVLMLHNNVLKRGPAQHKASLTSDIVLAF